MPFTESDIGYLSGLSDNDVVKTVRGMSPEKRRELIRQVVQTREIKRDEARSGLPLPAPIQSGIESSIVGRVTRGIAREPDKDYDLSLPESIVSGLTAIGADLASGVGMAGRAVPAGARALTELGLFGLGGGAAGEFQRQRATQEDLELGKISKEAGKGAAVTIGAGLAGKAGAGILSKLGPVGRFAGEAAGFAALPAALEGRLPTGHELAESAGVIGGLKLAHGLVPGKAPVEAQRKVPEPVAEAVTAPALEATAPAEPTPVVSEPVTITKPKTISAKESLTNKIRSGQIRTEADFATGLKSVLPPEQADVVMADWLNKADKFTLQTGRSRDEFFTDLATEFKSQKEPVRATPDRTARVIRGMNGPVTIEFPDANHKDLFSAIGRSRKNMRGEPGINADWKGLAARFGVTDRQIGSIATEYRKKVMDAANAAKEDAVIQVPDYQGKPGEPQKSGVLFQRPLNEKEFETFLNEKEKGYGSFIKKNDPQGFQERYDAYVRSGDPEPLFQGREYGFTQFFPNETRSIITILKSGNISTVQHELAHVYQRHLLRRLEMALPDYKPAVEADIKAIEKWIDLQRSDWGVITKKTRPKLERFARGYERYLRDGHAPTEELKGVFQRLKEWFSDIYTSVKELERVGGGELPKEVRKMFDRQYLTPEDRNAVKNRGQAVKEQPSFERVVETVDPKTVTPLETRKVIEEDIKSGKTTVKDMVEAAKIKVAGGYSPTSTELGELAIQNKANELATAAKVGELRESAKALNAAIESGNLPEANKIAANEFDPVLIEALKYATRSYAFASELGRGLGITRFLDIKKRLKPQIASDIAKAASGESGRLMQEDPLSMDELFGLSKSLNRTEMDRQIETQVSLMTMEQKLALANRLFQAEGDPTKLAAPLDKIYPSLFDAFIEGSKAIKLTSPPTHVMNTTANHLFWALNAVERQAASLVGKLAGNQQISTEGNLKNAYAFGRSWTTGLRRALEDMKYSVNAARVLELPELTQAGKAGETGRVGAIGGRETSGTKEKILGRHIRLPFQALVAGDAMSRYSMFQGEVSGRAFEQARSEGLTGDNFAKRLDFLEKRIGLENDLKRLEPRVIQAKEAMEAVEGKPNQKLVEEYLQGVSTEYREIENRLQLIPVSEADRMVIDRITGEATAATDRLLFQERLGEWGQKGANFLNAVKPLQVLIPFFKTPVNVAKQAFQRAPGTSLVSPRNFKAIFGDSVRLESLPKTLKEGLSKGIQTREGQEAVARILIGHSLGGLFIWMGYNGLLTGRGPDDRNEQDLLRLKGWQPGSAHLLGRYMPYQRLSPLSEILSAGANIGERARRNEQIHAGDIAQMTGEIIKSLGDQPFLMGVKDFLDFVDDPDKSAKKLANNLITGASVPSVSGWMARLMDPTVRKPTTLGEAFSARIPGLTGNAPAIMDILGREVKREGNVLVRAATGQNVTEDIENAIADTFLREGMEISRPGIRQEGFRLKQEEVNQILAESGPVIEKALHAAVTSPQWQRLDTKTKERKTLDIIHKAREEVKAKVVSEAQLRDLDMTGSEAQRQYLFNVFKSDNRTRMWKKLSDEKKREFLQQFDGIAILAGKN